jgi:Na+-transporting methylmalonyl-CoA/oxaloacetate decarboxylase gamma subunit
MDQITQSLLITAIGMGLVFILIILLWGFMAALVTITNRWDFMAQIEAGPEEATPDSPATPGGNKPGIVAVAITAAIASGQKVFRITPPQPGSSSSWQAVTRANTLSQISAIFTRKPRG